MMMFCDKVCILAGRWVDIAVCLCLCECVSVCLGACVCVCESERGTADAEALLLIKSSCSYIPIFVTCSESVAPESSGAPPPPEISLEVSPPPGGYNPDASLFICSRMFRTFCWSHSHHVFVWCVHHDFIFFNSLREA